MDEIKSIVEKMKEMSVDELKKAVPDLASKAKAVGYAEVAKELSGMTDTLKDKLAEFEVDDALDLMKSFMPMMFDGMKELAESNEDVQDELEDVEDTVISMVVEDGDFAMTFIVKEGKFDYSMEAAADADLTMKMDKATMKGFMSGEADVMQAYMSGDIKAEGNLTKAMGLRSIFEALGDEFGFDMMG